jgi:excisionase family DNA binding protein
VVRPEKVAELLDISRSKVYEMLATGDLPSVLIGRCRRIPVEALRTWLTGQGA